jgi:hypothetical protein
MAENKKSFVLYSDQRSLIDLLSDEQAGKLLKHIFAYVNDENPMTDDKLMLIAFEPIKQQLKRDLVRWEQTKEGRSKAGKASAEAKKNQQSSTNSTNVNFVQQSSTNSTVNVNDNDNVNVNDILLKKETKKVSNNSKANTLIFPFPEYDFETEWNKWKDYKLIQHKFKYKSIIAEGMSLNKLILLSNNNFDTAVKIINQSIENGWKGFFEIKTNMNYGTVTTKKLTVDEQLDERKQKFARELIESIENSTNANSQE